MESKSNVTPITIAIVEDDQETSQGVVNLLSDEAHIRCIGVYSSGEAAVDDIPRAKPEVALVDINLPKMNGIECVGCLKKSLPKLQVLMLTKYQESGLIFNSLRAGASGYLLKKNLGSELVSAVEQVRAGGAPMSLQIARKVVDYFNDPKPMESDLAKLTPREQEVLALLAEGLLYKEISDRLGITTNTFRNYQRAIYEKLHVHSRTEAAMKYVRKY